MLKARACLLALSTWWIGCASAGEPQLVIGDAPPMSQDAPGPGPDGRRPVDASNVVVDGPVDGPPSGSCATPFTGALATWDFTSASGSQASTASSAAATGVTATAFTRSAGLTASSGAGSMNSTNWSTGALDTSKYYTLSLTPPAGCALDVTSVAIDALSSGSGPAAASLATSADAFGQPSTVSTSAPSTPAVTASVASGSLEIRIYGFQATSPAGTMRVRTTLVVTGALH